MSFSSLIGDRSILCRSFAEGVDVLTVEIEHIDASALEDVMHSLSMDVEPTPATLRLIQVGTCTPVLVVDMAKSL